MRTIVLALALSMSTVAFGNELTDFGDTERCASWARNAMYGATQFMRGASREVQFISRSTLLQLLRQSVDVGRDKLYILTDEGFSENDRGFLATSTLFGYDAMSIWKSRNVGYGPTRDQWRWHFMAICLEYAEI